jgi:outer membrane protein with beta-barrel domain
VHTASAFFTDTKENTLKRYQFGSLVFALGLCAAPVLQAQHQPTEGIRFGVGGGLTLPMGTFGDIDKSGWNLVGLIQLPISHSPIHLRFDAMYGQTSHKSPASGNTTLTGATADLLYHLGDHMAKVRPYVLGGLGFYNVDGGGGSESKLAFGFGGGILFGVGTMHAFLEGRYMSVQTSGSSLNFLPISLGVMFGQ